jgi:Zn-finger nucleic acid-binding protein
MYTMKRNGIEIDYCASCHGVSLERGELDKLVDREQSRESDRPSPSHGNVSEISRESAPPKDGDKKRQRRTGILAELFDCLRA